MPLFPEYSKIIHAPIPPSLSSMIPPPQPEASGSHLHSSNITSPFPPPIPPSLSSIIQPPQPEASGSHLHSSNITSPFPQAVQIKKEIQQKTSLGLYYMNAPPIDPHENFIIPGSASQPPFPEYNYDRDGISLIENPEPFNPYAVPPRPWSPTLPIADTTQTINPALLSTPAEGTTEAMDIDGGDATMIDAETNQGEGEKSGVGLDEEERVNLNVSEFVYFGFNKCLIKY